jgi:hypothetical protein
MRRLLVVAATALGMWAAVAAPAMAANPNGVNQNANCTAIFATGQSPGAVAEPASSKDFGPRSNVGEFSRTNCVAPL